MERISTSSQYNGVLINLMNAENNQTNISNQISSQQVSTDLQGYASQAETLVAMQSVQAQVTGYLNNSQTTEAELSTQDTGLTQVTSAATSASNAVTTALAEGTGDTLMQSLQASFQNAIQGLNTTFNGNYVFAGGNSGTAPVNVSTSLRWPRAVDRQRLHQRPAHRQHPDHADDVDPDRFPGGSAGIAAVHGAAGDPELQPGSERPVQRPVDPGPADLPARPGYRAQHRLDRTDDRHVAERSVAVGVDQRPDRADQPAEHADHPHRQHHQRQSGQASSDLSQAQLAVQASSRVFEALQSSSCWPC